MKTLNYSIIGSGRRGEALVNGCLSKLDGARCVAVCDVYPDKAEELAAVVMEKCGYKPKVFTDYKECLAYGASDIAIIATSWDHHIDIAIYAMEKGIAVGLEVGGAYSLDSLWQLVRCYERCKTPIMMLENCCYGRLELLALNMKRLGLLGRIVHCEGGYCHDLRHQVAHGIENRHYRHMQYKLRCTDNYPTHDLGPIAKLLDINCGNRFVSLHSTASLAVGMKEYCRDNGLTEYEDTTWNQGDIITTVLKCQNGETVTLTLDTTLPRYYSRRFMARGSRGIVAEDGRMVYLESDVEDGEKFLPGGYMNVDGYYEKYDHPLWQGYTPQGGHGGMDYLMMKDFFAAVRENRPTSIDVYDIATWMAVTVLSDMSIATGQTVYFPDFTDGAWLTRENTFLSGK